MSKPSVVHIIDHLGLGGVQALLRAMLPLLPEHGYAPAVISLRGPTPLGEALAAEGVPVSSLATPKWSPRQLPALVARLRRTRPAIVHTHLTVGNLLGRLAAILAGVPAIVVEDQISVSQEIYGAPPAVVLAYRLIEPALARRTDRYLSPSRIVLAASRDAKGWPAERCRVRHNAVDCRRFAPAASRSAARAALGLPERTTVATFGRFVRQKRIGDLVEVAGRLAASHPHVQFIIAGGGPEEGAIRARIAASGLAERVLLLGRRSDTAELLAASDIYLSVSAGEVLSIAILEAMASGCAVVATDAGGTSEQVEAGVSGEIAPIGRVDALAASLARLLDDPARREAYGRAGRRIARQRFDLPAVAAAQAAIYAELLTTARPATAPMGATTH